MPSTSTATGAPLRPVPTKRKKKRPRFAPDRIAEVERRLAQLQSRQKVKSDLSMLWQIHPATVDAMIYAVHDLWAARNDVERPQRKAELRAALEAAVAKSYSESDMKAVIAGLNLLCKLDGVYEPDAVVQHVGIVIDVANPEAVRKRIGELQTRIAAATRVLVAKVKP